MNILCHTNIPTYILFLTFLQSYVHWIAVRTASAPREFVDAMMDGLAPCATSDLATCDATTTDNAKMVPVFVRRVGMESIAQYVSKLGNFFLVIVNTMSQTLEI